MTEWNAAEYARLSALQAAMAEEVLRLLRGRLRGDERVLDVGCGNGKVTQEIAAMVPRGSVIGVDASAKMVDFARELSAELGKGVAPANLNFEVCDARRLTFRDEFDLIVSFNALHWVPESEQPLALRGICAALKSNGTARSRLVARGERKSLENVIEETANSSRWEKYFVGHRDPYLHMSPAEYVAMAEQCGLRVDHVEIRDHAWDFGSTAAFAAFGTVTFVEWSQHVPYAERSEFVADALARYRPLAGDDHTFRYYQMDITARRA
ncbi:MAG: methyltransferase domain-containing protein [Acidobacteria bacterium]|nr:methyltransferase domain-containing protein [Acidobacteriota bacterium]